MYCEDLVLHSVKSIDLLEQSQPLSQTHWLLDEISSDSDDQFKLALSGDIVLEHVESLMNEFAAKAELEALNQRYIAQHATEGVLSRSGTLFHADWIVFLLARIEDIPHFPVQYITQLLEFAAATFTETSLRALIGSGGKVAAAIFLSHATIVDEMVMEPLYKLMRHERYACLHRCAHLETLPKVYDGDSLSLLERSTTTEAQFRKSEEQRAKAVSEWPEEAMKQESQEIGDDGDEISRSLADEKEIQAVKQMLIKELEWKEDPALIYAVQLTSSLMDVASDLDYAALALRGAEAVISSFSGENSTAEANDNAATFTQFKGWAKMVEYDEKGNENRNSVFADSIPELPSQLCWAVLQLADDFLRSPGKEKLPSSTEALVLRCVQETVASCIVMVRWCCLHSYRVDHADDHYSDETPNRNNMIRDLRLMEQLFNMEGLCTYEIFQPILAALTPFVRRLIGTFLVNIGHGQQESALRLAIAAAQSPFFARRILLDPAHLANVEEGEALWQKSRWRVIPHVPQNNIVQLLLLLTIPLPVHWERGEIKEAADEQQSQAATRQAVLRDRMKLLLRSRGTSMPWYCELDSASQFALHAIISLQLQSQNQRFNLTATNSSSSIVEVSTSGMNEAEESKHFVGSIVPTTVARRVLYITCMEFDESHVQSPHGNAALQLAVKLCNYASAVQQEEAKVSDSGGGGKHAQLSEDEKPYISMAAQLLAYALSLLTFRSLLLRTNSTQQTKLQNCFAHLRGLHFAIFHVLLSPKQKEVNNTTTNSNDVSSASELENKLLASFGKRPAEHAAYLASEYLTMITQSESSIEEWLGSLLQEHSAVQLHSIMQSLAPAVQRRLPVGAQSCFAQLQHRVNEALKQSAEQDGWSLVSPPPNSTSDDS